MSKRLDGEDQARYEDMKKGEGKDRALQTEIERDAISADYGKLVKEHGEEVGALRAELEQARIQLKAQTLLKDAARKRADDLTTELGVVLTARVKVESEATALRSEVEGIRKRGFVPREAHLKCVDERAALRLRVGHLENYVRSVSSNPDQTLAYIAASSPAPREDEPGVCNRILGDGTICGHELPCSQHSPAPREDGHAKLRRAVAFIKNVCGSAEPGLIGIKLEDWKRFEEMTTSPAPAAPEEISESDYENGQCEYAPEGHGQCQLASGHTGEHDDAPEAPKTILIDLCLHDVLRKDCRQCAAPEAPKVSMCLGRADHDEFTYCSEHDAAPEAKTPDDCFDCRNGIDHDPSQCPSDPPKAEAKTPERCGEESTRHGAPHHSRLCGNVLPCKEHAPASPPTAREAADLCRYCGTSWQARGVCCATKEARDRALEEAAQSAEAFARNYPKDVFPPEGKSIDCVSARAMRHAASVVSIHIRALKSKPSPEVADKIQALTDKLKDRPTGDSVADVREMRGHKDEATRHCNHGIQEHLHCEGCPGLVAEVPCSCTIYGKCFNHALISDEEWKAILTKKR